MTNNRCDVVLADSSDALNSRVCYGVKFGASFGVGVRLNIELLRSVMCRDVDLPNNIGTYTKCCWANVVLQVVRRLKRRLSERDTRELIAMVQYANSKEQNVTEKMSGIITRLGLPVTFVEYYKDQAYGTLVGEVNGPVVACVLSKCHYTLQLPVGSVLASSFTTASMDTNKHAAPPHSNTPSSGNVECKGQSQMAAVMARGDQSIIDAVMALSLRSAEVDRGEQSQMEAARALSLRSAGCKEQSQVEAAMALSLRSAEVERKAAKRMEQMRSDELYARSLV